MVMRLFLVFLLINYVLVMVRLLFCCFHGAVGVEGAAQGPAGGAKAELAFAWEEAARGPADGTTALEILKGRGQGVH